MAENKKSFLLYRDIESTLELLTDEEAGKLFKHILNYVNDRNPELTDLTLKLAFEPIKQSLKRDLKHWESVKEKRIEAGKLGGLAKQAKARNAKQKLAKPSKSSSNSNRYSNSNSNCNKVKEFYNTQIQLIENKSSREKYSSLVDFLYGQNSIERPLDVLLKYRDQLTYAQYETLKYECVEHNQKLFEVLLNMENVGNPKKRKTIHAHALNFIRPFKK